MGRAKVWRRPVTEDDFDAGGVGAAQRGEIVRRNLELRVEEGAVDI